MELRAQHRSNGTHDLRIESIDEDNHAAQRCNQQLIPAERLFIDELADVEYGCLSQSGVNISARGRVCNCGNDFPCRGSFVFGATIN